MSDQTLQFTAIRLTQPIGELFVGKISSDKLASLAKADMPEANRFVLYIMAAVAEQEGRAISERTKAALAAAKARGVKLGWSIPERASEQRQAARKGAAANKARALAHAKNVLPVVEQIRSGGASLRQIAAELNARGIKTARGGKWHATTVRNILSGFVQRASVAHS